MRHFCATWWRCAALLLAVLTAATGRGELLAYEDFNYGPVGADLTGNSGGGSFGFADAWAGQTSYNIGSGSIASTLTPVAPVGNSVTAVAFGENRGIDRQLVVPLGADDTTRYVSVMIRPQGILHQGAYDGWFGLALRGTTFVVIGMNYSQDRYGLRIADVYRNSSVPVVVGQPALLVLRIDFTEGVDSTFLYVNPQPGLPEPTAAQASEINLDFRDLATLSITGPGAAAFDAIRIGTTYADVAPATADFDGDGIVDGADLSIFASNFGATGVAAGDANFDGTINGADFLQWQRQFGFFNPPPAAAAIPEPAAAGLLLLASGGFAARSRRGDSVGISV